MSTSVIEIETLTEIVIPIADEYPALSPSRGAAAVDPLRVSTVEPLDINDEAIDNEASSPGPSGSQYPTGTKFWFIALAIGFVLLLGGLDATIVATAVPAITDHFHTVVDVGWYYSAYRLCSCAFQFMFGKLYKIFSMKRMLMISVGIFLVGSLLCATASSSKMFVVGRAVTGLGASGVIAGCWNLIVHLLPLHKRGLFLVAFGAIESVSSISAPILGGILTQKLSWRWCFWINFPLGGIALLALVFFLSDLHSADGENMSWQEVLRQLDLMGNLVFIPSMTCLFIALSWAGTRYAWNSPIIIGLLVAFGVLASVFVIDQFVKQDSATLPPRILKDRNVIAGAILSFSLFASINTLEYYMPTYFQAVRGFSPAESGYMMIPLLIGSLIGYSIIGGGTSITGFYAPFAILCSIMLPVAVGLVTTWKVDASLAQMILYSGFAGFASGIGVQAPQHAVQTTLSPADAPLGMAVVLFTQGFGPALSVSIAQTILTSRLAANLHHIAPNLDVESIENMGLTQLKMSVGAAGLDSVLVAFDKSLSQTWYLAVGLACATVIGSLTMEWRSVKQKTN